MRGLLVASASEADAAFTGHTYASGIVFYTLGPTAELRKMAIFPSQAE